MNSENEARDWLKRQRAQSPYLTEDELTLLAFEAGYDKGHEEGYDKGYDKGREEGYAEGREEGYAEGREDGHDARYVAGRAT